MIFFRLLVVDKKLLVGIQIISLLTRIERCCAILNKIVGMVINK